MMATAIVVIMLIMKVITGAVKAKVAIATVVVMTMKTLIEIGHSKPNSNDRNDDNKNSINKNDDNSNSNDSNGRENVIAHGMGRES